MSSPPAGDVRGMSGFALDFAAGGGIMDDVKVAPGKGGREVPILPEIRGPIGLRTANQGSAVEVSPGSDRTKINGDFG